MQLRSTLFSLTLLCGTALAGGAQASALIADNFTRVSAGESVTAPFTAGNGVATAGSYTGSVEVLVSGNGYSYARFLNDAFYYTPSGGATGAYYKLGIGTSAEPLAPYVPSRYAARLISFIDGVGSVPADTAPAFAADGVYHFVIDLGALSTQLSFGVLDGQFSDNYADGNSASRYDVQVWQLRPGAGAVPEPASWALMIAGFGLAGSALRRRTARVAFTA